MPHKNECKLNANDISFSTLEDGMSNGDIVQCDHCHTYFIWDKLPWQNIKEVGNGPLEHFGTPCQEMIVIGFICPECENHNEF